ncbi:MAG: hypothetical protein ACI8W3_000442 [Myxococcota bacterium]
MTIEGRGGLSMRLEFRVWTYRVVFALPRVYPVNRRLGIWADIGDS